MSGFLPVFFFNVTATTEIYTYGHTLSLHDALPISPKIARQIAATISLGTKVNVCSLIDVAACTMPSSTPMMSTGSSSGAAASARIPSACCETPTKSSASTELPHQRSSERPHRPRTAATDDAEQEHDDHRDSPRRHQ